MKNLIRFLAMIFVVFFWLQNVPAQQQAKESHAWWNEGYFGRSRSNPLAKKLPLILVKGNKFVNSQGDTLLFRGLSISDPDKLESQGYWNKSHFEKVKLQ